MGSPLADPDLAYLNLGYDRDTAEKEYIKQDSEHMEALEAAYGRLRQQNSAMTEQLKVGPRQGWCARVRLGNGGAQKAEAGAACNSSALKECLG